MRFYICQTCKRKTSACFCITNGKCNDLCSTFSPTSCTIQNKEKDSRNTHNLMLIPTLNCQLAAVQVKIIM
uniref:Uncharacterized protein n=1 Tax=Anguilla anguilla TaxID=7936 RepID=A0A0E9XHH3_ANGAN